MPRKIILDLRNMPVHERHVNIFDTFNNLKPDDIMELVNDHDPQTMKEQLSLEMPGMFEWNPVEQGPIAWRVDVKKTSNIGKSQNIKNAMANYDEDGFNHIKPIH